jgi:GAF domain-containing protein
MTDAPPPAEGQAQLAEELGDVLARMGGVLLSVETVDTAVGLVTQLAVETLAGSSGAGVSLVDERGKRSTASSNSLVEQADALQYQFDSGPCLTAWRDRVMVRIDDVNAETRWPEWTASVASLGIVSMLSAPMVAGDTSIGAIKVYSPQAHAYGAPAERVLHLFAEQAAILLANTQTVAEARRTNVQLTEALQTRDLIARAKGILLERGAADDAAAFAVLVTAAQQSNTKLSVVARQLVESVTRRSVSRRSG